MYRSPPGCDNIADADRSEEGRRGGHDDFTGVPAGRDCAAIPIQEIPAAEDSPHRISMRRQDDPGFVSGDSSCLIVPVRDGGRATASPKIWQEVHELKYNLYAQKKILILATSRGQKRVSIGFVRRGEMEVSGKKNVRLVEAVEPFMGRACKATARLLNR